MKPETKPGKKIFLYGQRDLLLRAVETFLCSREEWEVIRISDKYSLNFLNRMVRNDNPDAVIICEGNSTAHPDLPTRLIQDYPDLKVIIISLEENTIEVFKKQKFLVSTAADLLSVVES